MKHILSLDIEDFSPVDIKYGVYKRAESGEIILLAYSLDYGPVIVLDLTKEKIPAWLLSAFTDPNYIKRAYNAPYERGYLNTVLDIYSPAEQWECSLVRAAMCGLPLSLDDASKALGLIEKKDPIGKSLIRYFCIPCKPTAVNGMRTRNLPEHDPEKWEQFKNYNKIDVEVEQAVHKACEWYSIPKKEHQIWCLNELKNERGIKVDIDLIDSAMELDRVYRAELTEEAVNLTGLKNVNSPTQLKKWLELETEDALDNLNKQTVSKLLNEIDEGPAKRILRIRQLMSRSSIKKYASMKAAAGEDFRVRGLTQYYGANRTGREAGRIFNGQNFRRIEEWFEPMLDDTREVVKRRDIDSLHMIFPDLSDVLSQLLRPTFIADEGNEFIVLDFTSVEAVTLSCLADETWLIKAFANKEDVYKKTAVNMFKVPFEEVTKDQRQKAKISFLLGQYGGSHLAMERMNETIEDPKKRIPVKEMPGLIKAFREANANIVQLWWDTDAAAKNAIRTGEFSPVKHGIAFGMKNGNLLMKFPSGRCIVYHKAHLRKFYIAHIPSMKLDEETKEYVIEIKNVKVGEVRRGTMDEYYWYLKKLNLKDDGTKPNTRETVCFWGQNQTTKQWGIIETFGPRLVENFTQGISRDLLMHSIMNIENAGYPVVLSVHDECVLEVKKGSVSFDTIKELMLDVPEWAKTWPIFADGFVGDYYKK
jgi:DNA polymerase